MTIIAFLRNGMDSKNLHNAEIITHAKGDQAFTTILTLWVSFCVTSNTDYNAFTRLSIPIFEIWYKSILPPTNPIFLEKTQRFHFSNLDLLEAPEKPTRHFIDIMNVAR